MTDEAVAFHPIQHGGHGGAKDWRGQVDKAEPRLALVEPKGHHRQERLHFLCCLVFMFRLWGKVPHHGAGVKKEFVKPKPLHHEYQTSHLYR